jgi:hypothetical protein
MHDPNRQVTLKWLMVAVAGVALFLAAASSVSHWIAGPNVAQRQVMCRKLASEIDSWKVAHGRLPATLEEAGLHAPRWFRGGFRYTPRANGFTLEIIGSDGAPAAIIAFE